MDFSTMHIFISMRKTEMKKMILTVSVLSLLAFLPPVWAGEAHHPAGQAQETAAADMEKMDIEISQLQEMRRRIEAEQAPAARRELLRQHMRMMRETMAMMDMEGGMGMMGEGEPGTMDAEAMAIMEKKMEMMQEMMQGMALQQEMVKGTMKRTEEVLK